MLNYYQLKILNELEYYLKISVSQKFDIRSLRYKIRTKEYNRLSPESKEKLIKEEQIDVRDLIPNPILIKNKDNAEVETKKALQQLILEDIEQFIQELGNNFSFIGSE